MCLDCLSVCFLGFTQSALHSRISVLKCKYDHNLWNMYQILFQECDWIFPFENICLICDRPTQISFSVRHHLCMNAEPIMQFSDGFKVFE
ncbi:DUF6745 domain-containing protein [Pseudanabaena sp. lw0831]|uniref:DUF6745 domain-containing protein n=1 Tax=Pseudanabaena sp. lw0831 TaxID=1357935 RepID=UPI0027DD91DC|nr:hypothetical protein [Pseudanabaena sp. lw0831]